MWVWGWSLFTISHGSRAAWEDCHSYPQGEGRTIPAGVVCWLLCGGVSRSACLRTGTSEGPTSPGHPHHRSSPPTHNPKHSTPSEPALPEALHTWWHCPGHVQGQPRCYGPS